MIASYKAFSCEKTSLYNLYLFLSYNIRVYIFYVHCTTHCVFDKLFYVLFCSEISLISAKNARYASSLLAN